MDSDGETTYETPMSLCLTLKYTFICVYCWTRQGIHNTVIVVDWYLRLMVNKTIPDFTTLLTCLFKLTHDNVIPTWLEFILHTIVMTKYKNMLEWCVCLWRHVAQDRMNPILFYMVDENNRGIHLLINGNMGTHLMKFVTTNISDELVWFPEWIQTNVYSAQISCVYSTHETSLLLTMI